MSGKVQEGWDWMPSAASTATITRLMNTAGWYFVRSDGGTSLIYGALTTGRYGNGQALQFNGGVGVATWFAVKPLSYQNNIGGYVSCGFKLNADNAQAVPIVGVYDTASLKVQASVTFDQLGVVRAWQGSPYSLGGAGTELGVSDPAAFYDETWVDAEAYFFVDPSAGEIAVRINGVPVLTLTNVDTRASANGFFDAIFFGHYFPNGGSSGDWEIDDFRFHDTAGTINNSWLGTCRVQACLPAGDGATTDFTRSNTSLANWQNIANQNVDDTLYLYDGSASDLNLSALTPLINSPVVFWVGVTSFIRQDDATQITAKNVIVSGGTTAYGAAYNTSQTYTGDTDVWELDPHTGVQFTGAGVNALQAGPLVFAIA
jgi:hypothetical protein